MSGLLSRSTGAACCAAFPTGMRAHSEIPLPYWLADSTSWSELCSRLGSLITLGKFVLVKEGGGGGRKGAHELMHQSEPTTFECTLLSAV